jgi:hypothetical protein
MSTASPQKRILLKFLRPSEFEKRWSRRWVSRRLTCVMAAGVAGVAVVGVGVVEIEALTHIGARPTLVWSQSKASLWDRRRWR